MLPVAGASKSRASMPAGSKASASRSQASSARPGWVASLTSASSRRARAWSALSASSLPRHTHSCRAERASDHINAGAQRSPGANAARSSSASMHHSTIRLASTTSTKSQWPSRDSLIQAATLGMGSPQKVFSPTPWAAAACLDTGPPASPRDPAPRSHAGCRPCSHAASPRGSSGGSSLGCARCAWLPGERSALL